MYVLFEVHLALLENSLVILMKFGECSTIMCWIGVKIPGGAQILVTPIMGECSDCGHTGYGEVNGCSVSLHKIYRVDSFNQMNKGAFIN